MMSEKDMHYILVKEVEKRPLLYNYMLPEYSKKHLTEKAWIEIAEKTTLTVSECKEKWRNIRSTYLRSTKLSPERRRRKPYYLRNDLAFIIPFAKTINDPTNHGIKQSSDAEHSDEDEVTEQQNEGDTDDSSSISVSQTRKQRKLLTSEDTGTDVATTNQSGKRIESNAVPKENNYEREMNHFFLSILSEFNDMDKHQVRTFKIQVLQLIDDIKQRRQMTTGNSIQNPYQNLSPNIPGVYFNQVEKSPVSSPSYIETIRFIKRESSSEGSP